jgi:hypothetical protein
MKKLLTVLKESAQCRADRSSFLPMKKILLGSMVALIAVPVLHADVIYRETFGETVNNNPLSDNTWAGAFGATGSNAFSSMNFGLSNNFSKPGATAPSVNAGVSTNPSTTLGFVFSNGGTVASSNWLAYTNEYTVDTSLWTPTSISFYSGNAAGATIPVYRIAAQIGGNWYATDSTFANATAVTAAGNFQNAGSGGAELMTFAWTNAAASWRDLAFTLNTTMTLSGTTLAADLPTGNITGFGLYSEAVGGTIRRFDTFEINATATPEPTTVSLLLATALVGLSRRRRAV